MNELSRRANDVVARLCDGLILDDHHADEAADLIEQALLAERRLAMEKAIDLAYRSTLTLTQDEEAADAVKETMELNLLRAAAETEKKA